MGPEPARRGRSTAVRPSARQGSHSVDPSELSGNEIRQRLDRGEGALADVFVGDLDVELLLDEHDELERIDRVEAEPVDENRRGVLDVIRAKILESQPV